jgi:hypothetical protein
MRWTLLLLIGARLHAQSEMPVGVMSEMPVGIMRGEVVSRTATELAVRNSSGFYACFYDAHTYFERALAAGDPVEVLADRQIGSTKCYTRMVHAVDTRRSRIMKAAESFIPRGNLTLAGIVTQRNAAMLTLKTRDGETTLALRPDTRYWCDGDHSGPNALAVNTRVFIRAGRDSEGNVEVYQAAWGDLLPAP